MIDRDLELALIDTVLATDLARDDKAAVIRAIRVIRRELAGGRHSARRITAAAGTIQQLAPWILDRLFDAVPEVGSRILIGGDND